MMKTQLLSSFVFILVSIYIVYIYILTSTAGWALGFVHIRQAFCSWAVFPALLSCWVWDTVSLSCAGRFCSPHLPVLVCGNLGLWGPYTSTQQEFLSLVYARHHLNFFCPKIYSFLLLFFLNHISLSVLSVFISLLILWGKWCLFPQ